MDIDYDTIKNMLITIIIAICVGCFVNIYLNKSEYSKPLPAHKFGLPKNDPFDEIDSTVIPLDDLSQPDDEMNLSPFISCECDELQTWHPGRVEHKMTCKKFWSLNPNRTKKELLKFEGFLKSD